MHAVLVVLLGLFGTPRDVGLSVPPVRGEVVQRFVAPRCLRCAGHRGVTVATGPGEPVVAVRSGTITFAGPVAGRTYIVERVAPGVRVTYGWVRSVAPGIGEGVRVGAGDVLGTVGSRTYLGVRVGDRYVEPLSILGLWRPRLVGPGRSIVGSLAAPR